jgi:hypothetical protein
MKQQKKKTAETRREEREKAAISATPHGSTTRGNAAAWIHHQGS